MKSAVVRQSAQPDAANWFEPFCVDANSDSIRDNTPSLNPAKNISAEPKGLGYGRLCVDSNALEFSGKISGTSM